MNASLPTIKKIIKNPEHAAKVADLVYVTNKDLRIKRHRWGKGFYYTRNDKKIKNKTEIERFKNLVIPPQWDDVKITHLVNGHLQVVGRDAKRRKQYIYHPTWSSFRNRTKFFKMILFGDQLSTIRKKVEKDLSQPGMPLEKCLALIVRLMEETHIRIGNHYYAKKNKSYGLSTLRTRHVDLEKQKMKFHFVGKKGKQHKITLKNKRLSRLVLKCKEIPGWELFKYYDKEGNHHPIDSGLVNDYIQSLSGSNFSAKDFRTWAGTKIFFETVYHLGITENSSEIKSNVLEGFDAAADGLGNSRNVCRKYYVHPYVVELYESGKIEKYFNRLDKQKPRKYLSASEIVLLELLSTYKIKL